MEEGNSIFSMVFLILHNIIKRLIYMSNLFLLTQFNELEFQSVVLFVFFSINGFLGWTSILIILACPDRCSNQCLKSWKHLTCRQKWSPFEKRLFLMAAKSCRPIHFRIGKYSFVRKIKIIGYFYSLSVGTMEAVLSFREYGTTLSID